MARTARAHRLTDTQISSHVRNPAKPDLHDGAGLYLRKREAGAYWYLRAESPLTNSMCWYKLFPRAAQPGYPHKTLKAARDEAERLRGMLAKGQDPRNEVRKAIAEEQHSERQRQVKAESSRSVKELFAEFKQKQLAPVYKDGKRESGRADGGDAVEAHMKNHAWPVIGDMPGDEVTRQDLLKVLDNLREAEKYRMANVVLQLFKQFFGWAGPARRQYLPTDPSAGIDRRDAGGRNVRRKRVLCETRKPPKPDELQELAKRLPRAGLPEATQIVVWIVLATLVRIGELATAKWAHIDFEKGRWFIPRTKNQAAHEVHLSDFAVEQFKALRRIVDERIEMGHLDENCVWVLPGRGDGKNHIGRPVITKELTDRQVEKGDEQLAGRTEEFKHALLLPFGHWHVHDLRRTGATMMRQLGVDSETVHACLNHKAKDSLSDIYEQDENPLAQPRAFALLGAKLRQIAGTPEEKAPSKGEKVIRLAPSIGRARKVRA